MLIGVELEFDSRVGPNDLRKELPPYIYVSADGSVDTLDYPAELIYSPIAPWNGAQVYAERHGPENSYNPLNIARGLLPYFLDPLAYLPLHVNETCGMHVHVTGTIFPPERMYQRVLATQLLAYAMNGEYGYYRFFDGGYGAPNGMPLNKELGGLPWNTKRYALEVWRSADEPDQVHYEVRAFPSTTNRIQMRLNLAYAIALFRSDAKISTIDGMEDPHGLASDDKLAAHALFNGLKMIRGRYILTTNRAPATKRHLLRQFSRFFGNRYERVMNQLEVLFEQGA